MAGTAVRSLPRRGAIALLTGVLLLGLLAPPVVAAPGVASGPAPATPSFAPDHRILNGTPARIADLPWVVLITGSNWQCTGSVIAPTWVLTAAHCVDTSSAGTMTVRLGSATMSGFTEQRSVRRVVINPSWNRATARGDIALLELTSPTSQPAVALAPAGAATPVGARAVITGWGLEDHVRPTDRLLRAEVPVQPGSTCVSIYGPQVFDPATMVCAGGGSSDITPGDSGGPLLVSVDGRLTQFGISSYGADDRSITYSAFTAVAAYRTWIEQQTGPLTAPTPTPPPSPTPPPPSGPQPLVTIPADVAVGSPHRTAISQVLAGGLASGYPDGTFRPGLTVRRDQMATFLARAARLTDPGGNPFPDVAPGDTHAPGIRAIRAAGITAGRPDGTYGPTAPVTRGQMASFLATALGLSDPGGSLPFSDVAPGDTHAPGIRAIRAAGITSGRPDGTYGPTEPITRGQMAAFLARAFLPPPPDGGADEVATQYAAACARGDMAVCDALTTSFPRGSQARQIGDTCAGRQPAASGFTCTATFSTPLALACADGDMHACDELFIEADPGTLEEVVGDTCAFRQPRATGQWCRTAFDDLPGPDR